MQGLRRFRKDQFTRDKHAEVFLNAEDFICPYFIVEGKGIKREIDALKGVNYLSIDAAIKDIPELIKQGVDKVLLFGVSDGDRKDVTGSYAYENNTVIARAVAAIKKEFPTLVVMTDVCLCGYTSHGHCGVVDGTEVKNEETLPHLANIALTHAQAGVDIVAPSAMMDGQVAAIRQALDGEGFREVKILSYSIKYASSMYAPFRDVVQSAPSFGDRRSYQMDFRNVSQAIQEAQLDIVEGADFLMVKPAHTYLDIIRSIKNELPDVPLAAYHVSGEYMMIKAAAQAGFLDEREAMREALYAIKRAGADMIITYCARRLHDYLS